MTGDGSWHVLVIAITKAHRSCRDISYIGSFRVSSPSPIFLWHRLLSILSVICNRWTMHISPNRDQGHFRSRNFVLHLHNVAATSRNKWMTNLQNVYRFDKHNMSKSRNTMPILKRTYTALDSRWSRMRIRHSLKFGSFVENDMTRWSRTTDLHRSRSKDKDDSMNTESMTVNVAILYVDSTQSQNTREWKKTEAQWEAQRETSPHHESWIILVVIIILTLVEVPIIYTHKTRWKCV